MKRLHIKWAKRYVKVIEDKYYPAYACRSWACSSKDIWPTGPYDSYAEALVDASSHLCDDDTCNVLLRKNNKWWRPALQFDDANPNKLIYGHKSWVEAD